MIIVTIERKAFNERTCDMAFGNKGERKDNQKHKPYYIFIYIRKNWS